MKLAGIHFFVFFLLSCTNKKAIQEVVHPFNLSIETVSKATQLFKGSTHYIVNDSSIRIFKTYPITEVDTNFIYFKEIRNSNAQLYFSNLRLDILENYYINENVLIISGQHFYID